MAVLPLFSTIATQDSRARAAYFAAGATATTVCSLLAALLALTLGVPGAPGLLTVLVVYNAAASVITALLPKGDYAKALKALRAVSTPPPARSDRR